MVIKPDRIIEAYPNAQDTDFLLEKVTIIEDRWTDSEGNIFYKMIVNEIAVIDAYELWKLSNSEIVFEYVYSLTEYPTEIDPNDTGYRILYRE